MKRAEKLAKQKALRAHSSTVAGELRNLERRIAAAFARLAPVAVPGPADDIRDAAARQRQATANAKLRAEIDRYLERGSATLAGFKRKALAAK